ncbi:MAG: CHASE2 domain-containing protein [Symploca sp. SIO2B6]|nr:CHASE2 domain-containing protein [Symploca sp. SIO2B6]
MKQKIWQWRGVLITATSVWLAVMLMRYAGGLQLLEWVAFDQFFLLRPMETPDPRIVIVTIDESDISEIGQWPIPDSVLVKVLQKLQQQQPRAIGLALYRNLPVAPGHQKLVEVFESTPNLIGIKKVVGNVSEPAVESPPVLAQLAQVAAADLVLDADGKLRRSLLSLKDLEQQTVLSLGTKLALIYLEAENITLQVIDESQRRLKLGKAVFTPLRANDGGYIKADLGGYQILSNFRRPRGGLNTVSLTAVLEDKIPPELVRDRVVLIGLKAESFQDRFYTPYSHSLDTTLAGVEVHADLTSQILSAAVEGRPLIRVWSEYYEWLWTFAWSGIGAILGCKFQSPRGTVISTALTGSGLILGAYLLFLAGWWIVVVPSLLCLSGAAITSTGYILWENLKLSHRQLADYARTLEQKVEARTLELSENNLRLQQEIHERRLAEAEIQRQLTAIEATLDGMAILNQEGQYIYLNTAHLQLFGYTSPAQLVGKTWRELYYPEEVERIEREIFPFFLQSKQWRGETTGKRRDGSTFQEEVTLTVLEDGGLACVCRDITERKLYEAQLQASLQEKELLLKEVYHRVKNNLQVITSIFSLQSQYIEEPQMLSILTECQNRIHSMALIHQKLYQSDSLTQIDFADYIESLAHQLFVSCNVSPNRILLKLKVTDVSLNLDTAILCGLLINELISNSLKHAFPGQTSGEISINFSTNSESKLNLIFKDNGVGLPAELDIQQINSLGLRLVRALTRQLKGKLQMHSNNGVLFQIEFPKPKERRRF